MPESLDYGVWREEHRDWFGREFPWVFEAQAALFREGGIDVDYVELMVVSGDAWQFHYDPGFLLLNKPIAVFDEGCMRRVARHFGVDEWWLLEAVGSSRWLGRGSGRGCSAAEYARGLERWREDILGGGPGRGKRTDAMLLFSMRASSYLSHARTAAYLWMREHPEEAERLRGVDGHFGECLLMLGGCLAGGRVDLGGLSGQLTALNRGNEMAQAMLMASPSPSPSCVSELEALWREFGRVLSGMLPEGSEGTEPAKGE